MYSQPVDKVTGVTIGSGVVRARADLGDLEAAAEALAGALADPGISLGLVFCSPCADPAAFIAALQARCPAVPLVGCTTAGEIDNEGFHRQTCVVMGLGWPGFRFSVALSRDIAARPMAAGRAATRAIARDLGFDAASLEAGRHAAISFIDGHCHRQESFIVGAAAEAPAITFVGASSADLGPRFHRAAVFCDGKAHVDAAVLIGLEPDAPFAAFVAEGGSPLTMRVVVTDADPTRRLVFELNGKPAAREYREICAAAGYSLDRALAAPVPFGYYVAGRYHLRSVVGIEGDALRFGSSIDVGTVLRLMQPIDVIESTKLAIADARAAVGGKARAVLAFHDVARFREAAARDLLDPLADLLRDEPLVGFNSFGEQINLLNINHAVTGLVIGPRSGHGD